MRTLIASVFALLAAGYVTFAISHNVADNVVAAWRFEAPDEAAGAHALAFMITSLLALFGGFAAGWIVGYPLRRRTR